MAKFDITEINFMTSGEKRGIINLSLKCNDRIRKKVYLLDKTFENGSELSVDESGNQFGCGIITESGKYKYERTDYISNYPQLSTNNPLAVSNDSDILILNENQTYISTDSLSGSTNYNEKTDISSLQVNSPFAIQLNTGEEQYIQTEEYQKWNEKQDNIRKDFVFETNFDSEEKNKVLFGYRKIMPLYDIQDVMFKSKRAKSEINTRIPKNIGQTKAQSSENNTQDIYYEFKDYPVAYCQFADAEDTYSFILTNPTDKQPLYLYSNFKEEQSNSNFTYQISSKNITTYLYKFAKEYGYDKYCEYLSSLDEIDEMTLMSVFSQYHCIDGIKYNYAFEMSQNGKNTKDSTLNYEDGNIPFNDIFVTKNAYNPLYSVQMSGQYGIDNCRQYCGIQQSDKRVVLKYYDNSKYIIDSGTQGENSISHNAYFQNRSTDGKYPYQKVEYFYKTNTNKITSHKSNLFSIKISKSGMSEDEDSKNTKSFVEKIRNDIKNNIREFVDNICPANTQLFDTYFI